MPTQKRTGISIRFPTTYLGWMMKLWSVLQTSRYMYHWCYSLHPDLIHLLALVRLHLFEASSAHTHLCLVGAPIALHMHFVAKSCLYASALFVPHVILANDDLPLTHILFLTFPEFLAHCWTHRICSIQAWWVTTVSNPVRKPAWDSSGFCRLSWKRWWLQARGRSAGCSLTWSVVTGGGKAVESESIRREASNCWGGKKKLGTTMGSGLEC